jgi:ribosome-associated protein
MSGPVNPELRPVEIRESSIRLGQLLKLADLVDAGSEAKVLLADGDVRVNGEVETRRGRQLERGDVVTVDLPTGPVVVVVS